MVILGLSLVEAPFTLCPSNFRRSNLNTHTIPRCISMWDNSAVKAPWITSPQFGSSLDRTDRPFTHGQLSLGLSFQFEQGSHPDGARFLPRPPSDAIG